MNNDGEIDVFIKKVDLDDLFTNIWEFTHRDIVFEINNITKRRRSILAYWKEHAELRFSQVLVNLGYIDTHPGDWYYIEDSEILLIQYENSEEKSS